MDLELFKNRKIYMKIGVFSTFLLINYSCAQDLKDLNNYIETANGQRLALVVGNYNYDNAPILGGVKKDIVEVTSKLESLRFDVTPYHNVVDGVFFQKDVMESFRRKVNRDDLVVIYLSGHGFSWNGQNYFASTALPQPLNEDDLYSYASPIISIAEYVGEHEPGGLIVIVDACRNPLSLKKNNDENEHIAKGLTSPVDSFRKPGTNYLILWAQKEGYSASVPSDAPSIYTSYLLKYITSKNKLIESVQKDAAADVMVETHNKQSPGQTIWSNVDIYLNPDKDFEDDYKEIWVAHFNTQDPKEITRFTIRHALNPYAKSARKWLSDYRRTKPRLTSLTRVSPFSVSAAWDVSEASNTVKSVSIPSLNALSPLAFQRKFSEEENNFSGASTEIKDWNEFYADLPGAPENIEMLRTSYTAASLIAANKTALITSSNMAKKAPNPLSKDIAGFGAGETVSILSMRPDINNNTVWLKVKNRENTPGYYQILPDYLSSSKMQLGTAISSIALSAKDNGLRSLLNSEPLNAKLDEIAKNGYQIGWASIEYKADEGKELQDLYLKEERAVHARYLLVKAGVDSKKITISSNSNFSDNEITLIKIFAFKGS